MSASAETRTAANRETAGRTHWVDDVLLGCFNEAHAAAERQGSSEVSVLHLLIALAQRGSIQRSIAIYGFDATRLWQGLAAALPVQGDRGSSPPRTSTDVRRLLDAGRQIANSHGNAIITARDLLDAVIVRRVRLACSDALQTVFERALTTPTEAPTAVRPEDSGQPAHYGPSPEQARDMPRAMAAAGAWTATKSRPQHAETADTLAARLDRQEQLLWDVIRHLTSDGGAALPSSGTAAPRQQTSSTQHRRSLFQSWSRRRRLADSAPAKPHRAAPIEIKVTQSLDQDAELDALEADAEATGVKRYYLAPEDEIVCAPSIGPATAAKLAPHGVTHVKHLLACEPERLSARLGARHLTTSRIAAWKDQARLVCTIPWLRGTHAQLLVGAGYASIEKILSTDRSAVCAAVTQFSTTRDGLSILRNGSPPELDRIMRWIENTQLAEPQRAQVKRPVS